MTGSMALAGDMGFSSENGMWCPPGGVVSLVGISSGEAGPSEGWLAVSRPSVGCAL